MENSRFADVNGEFTINATDNTGYSLVFYCGTIGIVNTFGSVLAEFDADDIPAADVAPVVHGEWERILCDEDAYEHHRCSICKEYARFSYLDETVFDENSDGEMEECGTVNVDIIEELTPFCPHCGAKMGGGKK